ncbi:MAG: MauE/DoxX family redox-associated membrane protein [Candidatus Marinimicrobia bacterium]|nr:MauE/DoxX family redox-associated membrane protein [Candidatus Neomarinimicrobiota bacterium]
MSAVMTRFAGTKYWAATILLLRMGLGLLFIYASLDKIWNPGLFAKAVSNYRILPVSLLHITAIILPWVEFIAGLALVFNRYPRAANILIGGMTLTFTLAIASAMARGLDFNCGCFNVTSEEVNLGAQKIFENLNILAATIMLEYRLRKT